MIIKNITLIIIFFSFSSNAEETEDKIEFTEKCRNQAEAYALAKEPGVVEKLFSEGKNKEAIIKMRQINKRKINLRSCENTELTDNYKDQRAIASDKVKDLEILAKEYMDSIN